MTKVSYRYYVKMAADTLSVKINDCVVGQDNNDLFIHLFFVVVVVIIVIIFVIFLFFKQWMIIQRDDGGSSQEVATTNVSSVVGWYLFSCACN